MTDSGVDVSVERVSWIKWLRQRDGLAREKKGVPYELFGVHNHEGLVRMLSLAVRYDGSLPVKAVGNALHLPQLSVDSSSVIERRSEFAVTHGISVSTVERLEERGFDALDSAIQKLRDPAAIISEFERMDDRLTVIEEAMESYGVPLSNQTMGEARLRIATLRNETVEAFRRLSN